jgi:hypothetical protein
MRDPRAVVELTLCTEQPYGMAPEQEYLHASGCFVEGRQGQRYLLRVRNLTYGRLEVIPSVDGLDVHSGRLASFDQRGLVIQAQSSYDFLGFRVSERDVAAFRFGAASQSYAAQVGQPAHVGVIGLAVFEEQPPLRRAFRVGARGAADELQASGCAPAHEKLGTVFGERRDAAVVGTSFVRASAAPVAVLCLRYEDASGLRALGVGASEPTPFPADGPFCRPPRFWTGR